MERLCEAHVYSSNYKETSCAVAISSKQEDCRVAKRHQSKQQKLRMAPRNDVSVSFLAMTDFLERRGNLLNWKQESHHGTSLRGARVQFKL